MQSFISFAIVFAFVAVSSVRGDQTQAPAKKPALKCFTCHSCPDPFLTNVTQVASSAPKDCAAGVDSCFKYWHSDGRIQRGCASVDDKCPEDEGNKFNLAYCYTCYHNICNSARRVVDVSALPLLAALVSSLLGLAFWKRN